MTNYAEQFPACADCPRLKAWQASRDGMDRDFEEAHISDSLNRAEFDHNLEEQRVVIDEQFASVIDLAEAGIIPEERLATLQDAYAQAEEVTVRVTKRAEADDAAVDPVERFVKAITDSEARKLARDCHGTLKLSILGHTVVTLCRSSGARYAVSPPPPMPR